MAQTIETGSIEKLKQLYELLQYSPSGKLFVDYDKEADVLYVTFTEEAAIYMSDLTDDDILLEYDKEEHLVGVTILDASQR
jgi:uncharacterized protein YuzE